MDSLSLQIERKMKGLGFDDFRIENQFKSISVASPDVQFNAQNEYWFLMDVSASTDDFIIQGDNDIMNFSDINYDGIPLVNAFTGNITIEKYGEPVEDQDLLFVVAIPK